MTTATRTTNSPRFFDQWSASYDGSLLQRSTYEPIHNAVIQRVRSIDPGVVLDLGCGTGQLTKRLTERFPSATVVGVDYSLGMLHQATARTERLVQGDAQQLPLRPGSVDLITCTESFHWYRNQDTAAADLRDLLTPDGRLLIASIATLTTVGNEMVEQLSTARGRPIKALPPRQLTSLLERAGFDVTSQRRVPRLGVLGWPVLTEARPAF